MAWNPDLLTKYEEEMREKRQQQEEAAERENIEWDREKARRELTHLRAINAELLAALEAFLRAPSIGSSGLGSVTIEVQTFNLNAARAALAKAKGEA